MLFFYLILSLIHLQEVFMVKASVAYPGDKSTTKKGRPAVGQPSITRCTAPSSIAFPTA